MFRRRRIERRLRKVQPGDARPLEDFRVWQLLTRSVFFLDLVDGRGGTHSYAVDVRHLADELETDDESETGDGPKSGAIPAALFRDGVQVHRSDLPAAFPVPGGVVDVATSLYGLTRMHFVADAGQERTLRPHPRSLEGLRARFGRRFPRTSAVIGAVAVVVLLAGLVVALPLGLEMITRIELVAEHVGTFVSPISLPGWASTTLLVAGILAAIERALTLRNHWLVDLDTTGTVLG